MNISFVIPCYNCADYINYNIYKLYKKLKKLNIRYEIILIDDFSCDNTFFILKNNKNYGKSFSIIKGIKACKYDHVIFIDCDFPYFKSMYKIIERLKKNDMVIINRREKKSRLENKKIHLYIFMRIILGFIINYFIRIRFNINIKDTQAGLKGFKKPKNFSKIKFLSKRFFFDLELILIFLALKKKVLSLNTPYFVNEKSSINFFDFRRNVEILIELMKISLNYRSINEKTHNLM